MQTSMYIYIAVQAYRLRNEYVARLLSSIWPSQVEDRLSFYTCLTNVQKPIRRRHEEQIQGAQGEEKLILKSNPQKSSTRSKRASQSKS